TAPAWLRAANPFKTAGPAEDCGGIVYRQPFDTSRRARTARRNALRESAAGVVGTRSRLAAERLDHPQAPSRHGMGPGDVSTAEGFEDHVEPSHRRCGKLREQPSPV